MMTKDYNVLCGNLLVLLLGSFSASGCLLLLVFLASLNSPPLFPNAAQMLLSSNSKAAAVSPVSVSIAAAVRRIDEPHLHLYCIGVPLAAAGVVELGHVVLIQSWQTRLNPDVNVTPFLQVGVSNIFCSFPTLTLPNFKRCSKSKNKF